MANKINVLDFPILEKYNDQLAYLEQELNSQGHKKTFELEDGTIIYHEGVLPEQDYVLLNSIDEDDIICAEQIKRALIFIDEVLEEKESANYQQFSKELKNCAEKYLLHKKYFDHRDFYISNGSFIIALNFAGFETIKMKSDKGFQHNVRTNHKLLKNFEYNLYKRTYN